jgi:GGDEF domain-containing protein
MSTRWSSASAIDSTRTRLRSRLRHRSDGDDPQTGLPTWHRVEADLQRRLVMARRYGQPLAIAVMSVDGGPDLDRQYGQCGGRRRG